VPAAAEASPGVPVVAAALGGGAWLVRMPGGDALARLGAKGELEAVSQGPEAAGIRHLDMAGQAGWAWYEDGRCGAGAPGGGCRRDMRLMRTDDGGATWKTIWLADASVVTGGPALPSEPGPAGRGVEGDLVAWMVGQGFDKCESPTLGQLQVWQANSPYGAVKLYIGGVSRACSNLGLTHDYVAQASDQGWHFIPTWVGLQAPCTGFSHRMSYNPAVAYDQGRGEAAFAVGQLVELGLARQDGSGGVVYVDIEAYSTSDSACRQAVKAFIAGWSDELQAAGSLAGAYGADCASAPSDWATLPNPPDVLWVAHWDYNYYNPDVTVFSGMLCLPGHLWPNHQRIRQYTGGHNETWGGVVLRIDSDVLDGVVSDLSSVPCEDFDPCWLSFIPVVTRHP
jgi:hypothetical protein